MKRVSIGLLSIMAFMGFMVLGSSSSHAGYVHPGLLNNKAEYDLMKAKVAAHIEPWYSAYHKIVDYRSYTPHPMSDFHSTTTDKTDQNVLYNDAKAAYASALHWVITGNTQHGNKAKQILNAWAYTMKSTSGDDSLRLMLSWYTYPFVLTAEILKHTASNWSPTDQTQFQTFLRKLIIPKLQWTDIDGSGGNTPRNNWAAFGAMNRLAIGIYLNDQTLVTKGIADAKTLINFYIGTFGNPVPTGFAFETCRLGNGGMGTLDGGDLIHTQMGIGALVQAAEMAKKQGMDLYNYKDSSDNASLLTSLVYHAPFIGYPNRGSDATWPCDKDLATLSNSTDPVMPWQMAYNQYKHSALKSVTSYIGASKVIGTGASYDTLTHSYGTTSSSPALVSTPTNFRVVSSK